MARRVTTRRVGARPALNLNAGCSAGTPVRRRTVALAPDPVVTQPGRWASGHTAWHTERSLTILSTRSSWLAWSLAHLALLFDSFAFWPRPWAPWRSARA